MIKKKALAALLLAGTLTMGGTSSMFAAETGNTQFSFQAGYTYTESTARDKTNSTPVYVQVDASRPTAYIRVYGQLSTGWANCTYINGSMNANNINYVTVRPGVASSIRSTVYEGQPRGTKKAKLMGRSVNPDLPTYCVWSPDSTRTYTVLNP